MSKYKLVPVEPTPEMMKAGVNVKPYTASRIYAAMLDAAPEPDVEPVAWMHPESNRWIEADYDYSEGYGRSAKTAQQYGWRPLYAAPQPQPQQEPVVTDDMRSAVRYAPSSAYWSERLREFFGPDARDGIAALDRQIRDLLTQQKQPEQEPVAIHQFRRRGCSDWYDGVPNRDEVPHVYEVRTLYTAPQPAKQPLTDEQIQAVCREFMLYQYDLTPSDLQRIIRAIEAAHGITGDKT